MPVLRRPSILYFPPAFVPESAAADPAGFRKRQRLPVSREPLDFSLCRGRGLPVGAGWKPRPSPAYCWFGMINCVKPSVLMSRNEGVRGGSSEGVRKFVSKL